MRFQDLDVTSLPAAARARRGLGRTFQVVELCENLTVLENVILGNEAGQAGGRVLAQFAGRRSEKQQNTASALKALDLCGISDLASRQAGSLSMGQRRLVELARCLTGPFSVLLLDEPSSGLDSRETGQFGDLLRKAVRERSLGILLVEHDMSLVMSICDYIYVLDFGRLIFEGTPAEVAASHVVRSAYLGSDELEDELRRQDAEVAG